MSISRSDVMAISAERSDARLFQCETVIDIRQGFCWLCAFYLLVFSALTEGARRAIGVSAEKTPRRAPLFAIFVIPSSLLLSQRFSLHLKPMRRMD